MCGRHPCRTTDPTGHLHSARKLVPDTYRAAIVTFDLKWSLQSHAAPCTRVQLRLKSWSRAESPKSARVVRYPKACRNRGATVLIRTSIHDLRDARGASLGRGNIGLKCLHRCTSAARGSAIPALPPSAAYAAWIGPRTIRASCGGQRCAAAVAGPPGCRARWWKDVAKRRLVHAAPRHTHWDISMEICLIRHIGGLSQQAEDTWEKLKQGKLKH